MVNLEKFPLCKEYGLIASQNRCITCNFSSCTDPLCFKIVKNLRTSEMMQLQIGLWLSDVTFIMHPLKMEGFIK